MYPSSLYCSRSTRWSEYNYHGEIPQDHGGRFNSTQGARNHNWKVSIKRLPKSQFATNTMLTGFWTPLWYVILTKIMMGEKLSQFKKPWISNLFKVIAMTTYCFTVASFKKNPNWHFNTFIIASNSSFISWYVFKAVPVTCSLL